MLLVTRRINHFGRTLLASLLIWWDFASSQLPMACLPPGRYFATAPVGPAPMAAAPMGPAPGFLAASPPAIPPGCAPVIRPAMAAFAPTAPVAAMPAMAAAMPVLRTPPGFMPAAAFPAFTPAAAFPGLTPAAAFPALLPAAAIPFHTPAAAPGFLPTYSPSVAIPAAPLFRAPPTAAYPCFPVFKGKKMAKKDAEMESKPLAAKLVFRRGILLNPLTAMANSAKGGEVELMGRN